ncbi:Rrp9, partial [Symbiodinium microadriaticum]
EEDEFFETPDEKRVRLAKEYLKTIGEGKTREEVQEELAKDTSRRQVSDLALGEPRFLRGHKMAVTSVCLTADEGTMYTGGKDCAVLRWDVETGKKDVFPGGRNKFDCGGHFEKVLSVALLEEKGLLVSVGVDRLVRLWDPRAAATSSCVGALHGHMKETTSVVADVGGEQFYTASADKSLKIWDLKTRRCMETLLGHVDAVTSLDLLVKGKPLSGGADKSVRFWKVDKGTHLMFTRHTYAVDAVSVVDAEQFVSGGQDGNIMLWSSASKKPVATTCLGEGKWVSSLAAMKRANVMFSGGTDGMLRTWRCGKAAGSQEGEKKALQLLTAAEPIQAPGCINHIAVGKRFLALAVGKEHKFGRWFYDRKEMNGVLLVPLSYKES